MADSKAQTEKNHAPAGDGMANPAPLGLMGFGMTTVLLNLYNSGMYGTDTLPIVLGMGIFYGGLAQVIAGWWEFKKGNTFGATAFSSFGLFWLSLIAILLIPKIFVDPGTDNASFEASAEGMVPYLFMWGLFTCLMAVALFYGKANWALRFVFVSLALLFWLLAIGHQYPNSDWTKIAGYEGIICGLSAVYLATAEVINGNAGREVLPIFEVH